MNNFYSIVPSVLTFDFDLIFRLFLSHCGPNGLYFDPMLVSTTVSGSTHVVEQLSFRMFPLILIFDFYLIFGSFLTFWGPNGLFLGLE